MATSPIVSVVVHQYGCIQELRLPVGRLQALIGPNDSGKSTLLRAIRMLVHAAASSWATIGGQELPFDPDVGEDSMLMLFAGDARYALARKPQGVLLEEVNATRNLSNPRDPPSPTRMAKRGLNKPSIVHIQPDAPGASAISMGTSGGALLLRLDPDRLRQPSKLIPDGHPLRFFDDRGFGLAGVYDAIRNRGDDSFAEIAKDVSTLFPAVKYVGLRNTSENLKELQITLTDGTKVAAPQLSEGLLYYLAFAAVPAIARPAVVLVEEPENGLHPARIADVVRVLRRVSETSHVFIATHSPILVNELKPEEVWVTTRTESEGTRITRLDQTPNFEERSSVYQNGELWIAYADGTSEAPLLGKDE